MFFSSHVSQVLHQIITKIMRTTNHVLIFAAQHIYDL